MPHVSIIVPTHNRPQMLKDAVDSALAQTFRDFEVIVVLNGATAENVEMAKQLGGDPKVKVVEMEDSTLAASRNFGLNHARGEWIAFLDDDDIWLPEKLELQLAAAKQTGAGLVTCNYSTFNKDGDLPSTGLISKPAALSFAEALMLVNCVSGGSAAIVRASAIRELGGFDGTLRGCEDWDMWRRLAWETELVFVDRTLVKYRRHGTNMTINLDLALQAETQHFAKMLADTPINLRHMLPAAKRKYFRRLLHNLTEQHVIDGISDLVYLLGFATYQLLSKMTGGWSKRVFRWLREVLRVGHRSMSRLQQR